MCTPDTRVHPIMVVSYNTDKGVGLGGICNGEWYSKTILTSGLVERLIFISLKAVLKGFFINFKI